METHRWLIAVAANGISRRLLFLACTGSRHIAAGSGNDLGLGNAQLGATSATSHILASSCCGNRKNGSARQIRADQSDHLV